MRITGWVGLIMFSVGCAASDGATEFAGVYDDSIVRLHPQTGESRYVVARKQALLDARTSGGLQTIGATSVTFGLVLAKKPTANVFVTAASANTSQGTISSGASLTFTPTNWASPQTVGVTGVASDIALGCGIL